MIAVYFDKQRKGEKFNSNGLHPSMNGFTTFMEHNSNDWIYSNKNVQSLFSTTSGHYCVYFILYCCRGYSLHDIVYRFSSNLIENDCNINLFIRAFSLM